eukprot:5816878-Karenia_brevis.AAC.1
MIDSRIRKRQIKLQTVENSPRSVACGPARDDRKITTYLDARIERIQLEARASVSPRAAMVLEALRTQGIATSSQGEMIEPPRRPP